MISCDERRIEADYHSFIANHAGFFFVEQGIDYPIVLSKIKLGSTFETDFVVCRDGRSMGLKYEFVELETPDMGPYTKDGSPTARLSRAIQQIEDWRGWLAANRDEAKRLFPSWAFLHNDHPTFEFTIIIGTRENSAQWAHKRNALGERLNISIRSYDALTDVVENRRFPALETSRVDAAVLPPVEVLHELANPFFTAFTHADWAAIRAEPRFNSRYHMIQLNAEILLKHRKLNSSYSDFLQSVKTAPDEHQLDLFRHELSPYLKA
jgi:hypothetical protein